MISMSLLRQMGKQLKGIGLVILGLLVMLSSAVLPVSLWTFSMLAGAFLIVIGYFIYQRASRVLDILDDRHVRDEAEEEYRKKR